MIHIECHNNCKQCIGSGYDECTSCKTGFYLQLFDRDENYGTCVSKAGSSAGNKIYVTNSFGLTLNHWWNSSLVNTLDGSYNHPYDQLTDAIERAYEIAAPFTECEVEILIKPGTHYLIRSDLIYKYRPLKLDKGSHSLSLTIRPILCSEYNLTDCQTNLGDSKSVTVVNKRGGFF